MDKEKTGLPVEVRPGRPSDFDAIETFCERAILPAFDRPGLTPDQLAENRDVVARAKNCCLAALGHPVRAVRVASVGGTFAGFTILDRSDPACPEIDWFIVAPEFHGRGVAQALMDDALAWIGPGRNAKLGVIHYNARAIRFYEKHGFRDTGRVAGTQLIPRKLMVRLAASAP